MNRKICVEKREGEKKKKKKANWATQSIIIGDELYNGSINDISSKKKKKKKLRAMHMVCPTRVSLLYC